jgi:hypothetical protein
MARIGTIFLYRFKKMLQGGTKGGCRFPLWGEMDEKSSVKMGCFVS